MVLKGSLICLLEVLTDILEINSTFSSCLIPMKYINDF